MEIELTREKMQDAINEVLAGDKTFATLQTMLEDRGIPTKEVFRLMADIYSYEGADQLQ